MNDIDKFERMILWLKEQPYSGLYKPYEMADEMQLLLVEVKQLREEVERMRVLKIVKENERLRSEPTVTVDDYHKEGHLYVTIRFPDEEEYVGLVEKWEGDEE